MFTGSLKIFKISIFVCNSATNLKVNLFKFTQGPIALIKIICQQLEMIPTQRQGHREQNVLRFSLVESF